VFCGVGVFEKTGFCFVVGLFVERVLFLQERSRRGEERRGEEGDWVSGGNRQDVDVEDFQDAPVYKLENASNDTGWETVGGEVYGV
jgi:hypothetical protein